MQLTNTVLLAGGSGLVGRALTRLMADEGFKVIVLSRSHQGGLRPRQDQRIWDARWDTDSLWMEPGVITQVDYIINLAGAGVADKRWSDARKQEILESRTRSSETILQALKSHHHRVQVIVNASAIGWYGPDPSIPSPHPFTEEMPPFDDYLGRTCREWEASIDPAAAGGVRVVKLRTGIVLSPEGGAMAEFLKPLRFWLATILGSGKQMVSWIHIEDLCRIYLQAVRDKQMRGVYNAVAPAPVSNRELIETLSRQLHPGGCLRLRVPAWMLKIIMGEMSIEVLKSATVSSKKLEEAGFGFQYPDLPAALANLLQKKGR